MMVLTLNYSAGGTQNKDETGLLKGDGPNGELTKSQYIDYKLIVLCTWVGWIVFSNLLAGSEKAIFYVMGERLSYTVRMELFKSILHKQISWFELGGYPVHTLWKTCI